MNELLVIPLFLLSAPLMAQDGQTLHQPDSIHYAMPNSADYWDFAPWSCSDTTTTLYLSIVPHEFTVKMVAYFEEPHTVRVYLDNEVVGDFALADDTTTITIENVVSEPWMPGHIVTLEPRTEEGPEMPSITLGNMFEWNPSTDSTSARIINEGTTLTTLHWEVNTELFDDTLQTGSIHCPICPGCTDHRVLLIERLRDGDGIVFFEDTVDTHNYLNHFEFNFFYDGPFTTLCSETMFIRKDMSEGVEDFHDQLIPVTTAPPICYPIGTEITTGVEDAATVLTLGAYPNPCSDQVTITGYGTYEIFTLLGKTVGLKGSLNERASIDLSGLESGNYVCKVVDQGTTASIQITLIR